MHESDWFKLFPAKEYLGSQNKKLHQQITEKTHNWSWTDQTTTNEMKWLLQNLNQYNDYWKSGQNTAGKKSI